MPGLEILPIPLFDTLENFKQLKLPAAIDLVFAEKDFNLAKEFLLQYDGSHATFNSYRREIEKLLQWAWLIEKKSILTIRRAEIEAYLKFCQNPPRSWVGIKK